MNDKAKFLEVTEDQSKRIEIVRELFSDVYDTMDKSSKNDGYIGSTNFLFIIRLFILPLANSSLILSYNI